MKDIFIVKGNRILDGKISIGGSKNAALPIIAASLLASYNVELNKIPQISDAQVMAGLIKDIGAQVYSKNETLYIDPNKLTNLTISESAQSIRASILLAAPLLAKKGFVRMQLPGGCDLGVRKIDLHIHGLKSLGAKIKYLENSISIDAKKLIGTRVNFPFPSVGATENILMAATLADGETVISNSSIEPEVVDLGKFLIGLGAIIEGIGTKTITVTGVEELKGTKHTIMPDRIEAGTYIAAAAITGGQILLENCRLSMMGDVIEKFSEMGVIIKDCGSKVKVEMFDNLQPVDIVTQTYPNFPTDMHPIMTPLLLMACGKSTIRETIYENRFQYISEMNKLGAKIMVKGDTIIINGPATLKGSRVTATDLRGGAALVLAGLVSKNETIIENIRQIDRGYAMIDKKLKGINASIERATL